MHDQQSWLQVVSKQANSSPILESTKVDSVWQMIAEWTESTWPVWFDLLKTEKIISITVRMNLGENGLQFNKLAFLEHRHWTLLY